MRRSLKHYWRIQLAVLLGAATATAVLTGALLVGDSVRGSLRALTHERLGKIDYAVLAENLFREELCDDFGKSFEPQKRFEAAVPALLLSGATSHASLQTRAASVNICGIDERFLALFPQTEKDSLTRALAQRNGRPFQPVIINAALQHELQAQVGDQILLSFKNYSEIPRASLLGDKDAEDALVTRRFVITHVLPDRHLGRFGLRAQQQLPLNAFVYLPALQRVLEQPGKINALLLSSATQAPSDSQLVHLRRSLQANWQLEDLGLRVQTGKSFFSLTSRALILKPEFVRRVEEAAAALRLRTQPVLTYLANTMRVRERMVPYSTITALPLPVAPQFGNLQLLEGSPAPQLEDNEILLNEWAARELNAQRGDTIAVSYYVVGAREELATQTQRMFVRGLVQQTGLANDRTLTPPIPGVENAEDMQAWEPPFPVDLNLIRPQDEVYWDEHGATPKAFVSESTGRRLWRNRFGEVSAMRLAVSDDSDLMTTQAEFEKNILASIKPEEAGFVLQAVKTQGLQAAAGATDFGMLFIGFSLFLIASAILLLAMLFRLGIEQRAREIGTLLAVGYPLRAVRQRLFKEGMFVAALGAVLGTLGGLGYAWLLLIGLRTWWVEAVGTSFLFLHVEATSLWLGALCSLLIIALAIWWTVHRLGRIPATALLRGVSQSEDKATKRKARPLAVIAGVVAIVMFALAARSNATSAAGLFFGSGALLLIAGLAFLSDFLRGKRAHKPATTLLAMAARSNSRNPGRSMLSAALVSCACFIIVAVGANRRELGSEVLQKESGTGGFALMATSDAPLYHDFSPAKGRADLGFAEEDSMLFQNAKIFPLRVLPGEDASCLNLYKPEKPRVLGVPSEFIARGGFQFQAMSADGANNPWRLLETQSEPNVIPAFGDLNSVQWILHLGLGQDIVLQNERGEDIRLRFVGLMQSSIFQSEVLISEENFLKHFPGQSGYSFFLIETPRENTERLTQVLESTLGRYGFDVVATIDKLLSFHAVENTYLSVFQTLGGLGLLLGTLGLGLVLVRNTLERRGELATLRAFGFLRKVLLRMLLAENGFLLLLGIFIGGGAALLAVTPHLLQAASSLPWQSLFATLLLVFLAGLLACWIAAGTALRAALLPALKEE